MVLRDNDGHTSGDSPLPASELDFACDEVVTNVDGNLKRNLGRLVSFVGCRGTPGRSSIFPSPCTLGTIVPRFCWWISRRGMGKSIGSAQLTLGSLVVCLGSVPPTLGIGLLLLCSSTLGVLGWSGCCFWSCDWCTGNR